MSEPHECPHLIEVHRLWEGDLGAGRAREARRHLTQCAACRSEVEGWDRLSGLLARGDPARAVGDERLLRMKETLLAECAASLAAAGDPPRRRGAAILAPWRWTLPARMALALAPVALAALLLVHAGRSVPPGETASVATDSPGAAQPEPQLQAPPRPPRIALNPGEVMVPPAGAKSGPHPRPLSQRLGEGGRVPAPSSGTPLPTTRRGVGGEGRTRDHASRHQEPPPPPRAVVSRPAVKPPRRASRPRRTVRSVRPRTRPQEHMREPAARPLVASLPPDRPTAPVPAPTAAAPEPIERIVIQVDEPPIRPVETVTHITVIASGDLKAPDATLTVVKTEREETQP